MTIPDDVNPSDTPVDPECRQQPDPDDYWSLFLSNTEIPLQLKNDVRLTKLWDRMLAIASRHPERNLFHAILDTTNLMCNGIEDATEQISVLTPLAQELEQLNLLDRLLETEANTISDIDNKLKSTPKILKDRDALLDRLVTKAIELGKAHAEKLDAQENIYPFKETTAERDIRHIKRIEELKAEGMKVIPAAEQVHKEEVEAGRNPPDASTIKSNYTHRHTRPPGGKK